MAIDGAAANLGPESEEWVRALERAIRDLQSQVKDLTSQIKAVSS